MELTSLIAAMIWFNAKVGDPALLFQSSLLITLFSLLPPLSELAFAFAFALARHLILLAEWLPLAASRITAACSSICFFFAVLQLLTPLCWPRAHCMTPLLAPPRI